MDLEHEKRLTEVEGRAKSNTHRLDEMEKRQDDQEKLISTVAVLASKQEIVESDVKEIKSDVKSLTSKPGKRWDGLIDKIIMVIVGALVGYILTQIGL